MVLSPMFGTLCRITSRLSHNFQQSLPENLLYGDLHAFVPDYEIWVVETGTSCDAPILYQQPYPIISYQKEKQFDVKCNTTVMHSICHQRSAEILQPTNKDSNSIFDGEYSILSLVPCSLSSYRSEKLNPIENSIVK